MTEQHYTTERYAARESAGYMLRRLYSTFAQRLEHALAEHHCTLTHWIVLMYVRDGIAHTAGEICREFQHDSGALTRVIDQLESRGLLRRRRSARDRRVVELELTPHGQRFIETLLPVVVAHLNCAMAPLSAAEFRQFLGFLDRIIEHLQTTSPPVVAAVESRPKRPRARSTSARRPRGSAR